MKIDCLVILRVEKTAVMKSLFSAALSLLLLFECYSQPDLGKSIKSIKRTFTYKSVGSVPIKADFFSDAGDSKLKPVIVWIHGGGLIFGSRTHIREEQLNFYLNAGYSLFSIDYRLAPETKLPEIVQDIRDAVRWVRDHGRDSLRIDPNRIFLIGHSGGAYLALTAGYNSDVKPKAIISFYGYGDIRGDWYSAPDPFYLSRPLISDEKAQSLIQDQIVTSAPDEDRLNLYFYSRQKGTWPQLVSDHNPKIEGEWFKNYCPIENIDSSFPPVLLIHGDKDTDVPFTESVHMNDKLKSKGVKSKLLLLKNYDHVFDLFAGGLSNPDIAKVFEEVRMFLDQSK